MHRWRLVPAPLASWAVFDAVGQRLGVLDGWVQDGAGVAHGLAVVVHGVGRPALYLVPLGYLTQVDARRGRLHLRAVTRATLRFHALRREGDLPSDDALDDAVAAAPPASEALRRQAVGGAAPTGYRLPPPPDAARPAPPAVWRALDDDRPAPRWTPLAHVEGD